MIVTSTTPATAPMAVWTAAEACCCIAFFDGIVDVVDAVGVGVAAAEVDANDEDLARAAVSASDAPTDASVIVERYQRISARGSMNAKMILERVEGRKCPPSQNAPPSNVDAPPLFFCFNTSFFFSPHFCFPRARLFLDRLEGKKN